LSFYEGVGVGVLKFEESEWEVLKIEESESELVCADSTALVLTTIQTITRPGNNSRHILHRISLRYMTSFVVIIRTSAINGIVPGGL
jgi:hypothetical protein